MKLREAELKPGGQMVLVNFAKCDEGHFLGKSGRLGESMHHTFAEIWAELVTPEEFTNTNFPNQYRTLEATTAPFAGSSKELSMDLVSAPTRASSRAPTTTRFTARRRRGISKNHNNQAAPTYPSFSQQCPTGRRSLRKFGQKMAHR